VLSDLVLSDIVACWADSARTDTVAAVVSSTNAATEANHVGTQKGRQEIRNIVNRRLPQFS
jgi:hypothetical protein